MNNRTEKSLGEIISRIAMAVAAAALIYGGIQCVRFSWAISDEYYKEHPHAHHVRASDRPGYFSMMGGLALILTGGFLRDRRGGAGFGSGAFV
jgi:hypothetical protein